MRGVLEDIGFADAMIARETPDGLELIDGHLRQEVMGDQPVPVLIVDVTEEEADKMLLTYDPLAMMAQADQDQLLNLLHDTQFADKAVNDMLEALANGERLPMPDLTEPVDDPGPQIDRADELRQKWQTERGQVWEVGRHRLMCGDSTDEDDVHALIQTNIELVATSPPYSDLRQYDAGDFVWADLMIGAFQQIFNLSPVHVLVNLGIVHHERKVDLYWQSWLEFSAGIGWPLFGWYVWDKGKALPGNWNGRLAPAHEFVFHFNRENSQANKWVATNTATNTNKRFRQKDGSLRQATSPDKIGQDFKIPDSVIRTPSHVGADIGHPAVMGVGLAKFMIETWSSISDNCYDPFLGAGTTMVAAEQTGRICYGMEISPAYLAVTLERMAGMGLEPKLDTG